MALKLLFCTDNYLSDSPSLLAAVQTSSVGEYWGVGAGLGCVVGLDTEHESSDTFTGITENLI